MAAQPLFPARPVVLRSTSNYGLGHLHVVHCAGNLTAQPVRRLLRNLEEFDATFSRRTVFYAADGVGWGANRSFLAIQNHQIRHNKPSGVWRRARTHKIASR